MIIYLMNFSFILPSFCLKVVKHLCMAAAVIYHVRPTVKKTCHIQHGTCSACKPGWSEMHWNTSKLNEIIQLMSMLWSYILIWCKQQVKTDTQIFLRIISKSATSNQFSNYCLRLLSDYILNCVTEKIYNELSARYNFCAC